MQHVARVSHQCAVPLAEQGALRGIVDADPTDDVFGTPKNQRTTDHVPGRFG
ncbi:hypothetical protein [Streptomyces griseorubiginosus]|uniref:hypothetical protein n=1 Tax=Streptomyces griseorubiginosus TaxID=67304 RepID=UPI0033D191BF